MEDLRGREEDRRAGREGGAPAAGGGAVRASEGSGAACVVLNELNRTEDWNSRMYSKSPILRLPLIFFLFLFLFSRMAERLQQ